MPESQTDRAAALAALDVFVGEWVVEVAFPGSPTGRVVFEWALAGRYLLQRSSAPEPAPDSLTIIALGDEADPYLQHYFDSRGVTLCWPFTPSGVLQQFYRQECQDRAMDGVTGQHTRRGSARILLRMD
jgi:hypothetical protein